MSDFGDLLSIVALTSKTVGMLIKGVIAIGGLLVPIAIARFGGSSFSSAAGVVQADPLALRCS